MSTSKFNTTVSSIISSRLQYIKFKQQRLFETNELPENTAHAFQITDDVSAEHAHKLIKEFEKYSRANRLLTLMWNHLKTSNAKIIFELLSNNKYLNYTVEDLVVILNPPAVQACLNPINRYNQLS